MKKTIFLVVLLLGTTAIFAQEQKKTAPAAAASRGAVDQQRDPKSESPSAVKSDDEGKNAAQQAMMEYMTPGRFHQMLAASSGEWKEVIFMWPAPGATPTKNAANCVTNMILGGLYQETIHSGSFEGMDFYGRSVVGYDNVLRKFVSTWFDNMGSGIMYLEGTYDERTNTITFTGDAVDPMVRKKVKIREVLTMKGDNEMVFDMYTTPPGQPEFKTMQIVMTR